MKPQIVRCAFQLRNLRLRDLVGTGKVRRGKFTKDPSGFCHSFLAFGFRYRVIFVEICPQRLR